MIPSFPNFKKIELTDRLGVEAITKKFVPYSDFNFTSMWSWNTKDGMMLSQLNGNLIVRFTNYLTGQPFYSYLGNENANETAKAILDLSAQEGLKSELLLMPEESIKGLDNKLFVIEEDRDNFDYILDLDLLLKYDNSKSLRNHASFCRRLKDKYEDSLEARILDLNDENSKNDILSLTRIWMKNKISQKKDLLPGLDEALERYFIETLHKESFLGVGVFIDNALVGFTINEIVDGEYVICHFMKADNAFKGIYSYLVNETSKALTEKGLKYINFEQDLGLENLRQAKKTYEPVAFLKKYVVMPSSEKGI